MDWTVPFWVPKIFPPFVVHKKTTQYKYPALVGAGKKPYWMRKVTGTFVHEQTTCKLSWKLLSKVPLKRKVKQIEPCMGGHYLLPGNYWVPSPTSASSSAPVNNIVSCGCRSVVSGGIVGLIQCCLLWMESGRCMVALFVACTVVPLLWPPPQIGTLRRVWHDCHPHFVQYGAATMVSVWHGWVDGLIVGLIGWVAKAMLRSGHPRVRPLDFTIP